MYFVVVVIFSLIGIQTIYIYIYATRPDRVHKPNFLETEEDGPESVSSLSAEKRRFLLDQTGARAFL